MSLDIPTWAKVGLTGLTTVLGKNSGSKAGNQLSAWGNTVQPYLNAPVNVSTPYGGYSGSFSPDTGFNYDYNFDSPFRDQLLNVFDTTASIRPMGEQIFNSAGGFDDDRARFLGLYDDLGGLRGQVAPGFSELRDRRLEAVELARTKGLGDLRDSLARRRVSGSSFANDSMSRAQAEFGKLRSDTEAQTFLEEMEMTMRLIDQQHSVGQSAMGALQSRIQSELGAMQGLTQLAGIDASVAGQGLSADLNAMSQALGGLAQMQQFTTQMMSVMNANAAAQAELAASNAQGYGNVAGILLSDLLDLGTSQTPSVQPAAVLNGGRLNPYATSANLWD